MFELNASFYADVFSRKNIHDLGIRKLTWLDRSYHDTRFLPPAKERHFYLFNKSCFYVAWKRQRWQSSKFTASRRKLCGSLIGAWTIREDRTGRDIFSFLLLSHIMSSTTLNFWLCKLTKYKAPTHSNFNHEKKTNNGWASHGWNISNLGIPTRFSSVWIDSWTVMKQHGGFVSYESFMNFSFISKLPFLQLPIRFGQLFVTFSIKYLYSIYFLRWSEVRINGSACVFRSDIYWKSISFISEDPLHKDSSKSFSDVPGRKNIINDNYGLGSLSFSGND